MHKAIMLSATYQQSVTRSEAAIEQDPSNQYLSSFPSRRLDAESLRDTLLFLGGNLELDRPGEHPFPPKSTWKFTQHNPFKAVYESNHRSVYLMTQRIQRHPYLAIFDGADPSTSTATRMVTTTPLQSLYLLNNEFVHQQADRVAQRALGAVPENPQEFIGFIERCLLVTRRTMKWIRVSHRIDKANSLLGSSATDPVQIKQAWQSYVRMLFRLNEFIYLD